MQDRQNIEVDPTLVDLGWANMSQQLDEVMPVRKRRFFPWFFLLLFIAVGSSAGVYQAFYNSDSSKEIIEDSNLPTKGVKQKNTIIAEVEEIIDHSKKEESESNEQSLIQEHSVENSNPSISQQHIVKQTPSTIKSDEITPSLEEEVAIEEVIDVEHKIVPVEIETGIASRDSRSIALLSNENIELLNINTASLDKNVEHKGQKMSMFYLLAEAETGVNGTPQALGGGVGIQKKLGEKLNLDIGLNYQYVSSDLVTEALGRGSSIGEFNLDEQDSVYGTPSYSVEQTYNQLKIERLNLPILVTYSLGNRWDLGIGVQTSFYTKAVVEVGLDQETGSVTSNPNTIDNDNEFNLYDQSLDVYRLDDLSNAIIGLPYTLEPNRWQWSALFSAQYQVSKRIGIEAKYKTNITNWPDNNENYGASSSVGLGIKYFIR